MARIADLLRSIPSLRLFAIIGVLAATAVIACETPVYRYAMYRWQPAPYEVYFFHDTEADQQQQQVAELLESYGRGSDTPANIAYLPVNLAVDKELASVPPDVKKAWEDREDKSLPAYFVSTPYGAGLSFTKLDTETVQSLVESPARKSLAAQLETGKLGVFVMLTGKDEAETKQTEQTMKDLVAEVRSGKVSLYVSPTEAGEAGDGEEPQGNTDLGLMVVDRESPEEKWFVRSLLAMEPELDQEARPMVFLVYGRARALLPYIGKGITRENLLREIEFVSGACSCTVKEQNPGVDLLVRYDWESAAAALADRFGSEEGNESQVGPEMFFPELIIGGGTGSQPTELAANVETSVSDDTATGDDLHGNGTAQPGEEEVVADVAPAADEPDADASDVDAASAEEAAVATPSPAPDEVAAQEPPPQASPEVAAVAAVETPALPKPVATEATASVFSSVWVVGGGIAVTLLILFGLTFVVLRPQ